MSYYNSLLLGHEETIKLLLKYGVDISTKSNRKSGLEILNEKSKYLKKKIETYILEKGIKNK